MVIGDQVSESNVRLVASDGWKVVRVGAIQNPGRWTNAHRAFPPRFWAVYTKLLVWNLTDYERVVYLDADTIAARSLDPIFGCDGICCVIRHSERCNTGVLALTPDSAMLDDMLGRIAETPSYTGGDQGFINEYLPGLARAPLYIPEDDRNASGAVDAGTLAPRLTDLAHDEHTTKRLPNGKSYALGRLPTTWNADLGLYVLNSNRWMVPEDQLRVVHYTLAVFKPWDWWSSWIIAGTAAQWQAIRARLPPGPAGTGEAAAATLLFGATLPPILLVLALRRLNRARRAWNRATNAASANWRAARLGAADPTALSRAASGRSSPGPNGPGLGASNGVGAGGGGTTLQTLAHGSGSLSPRAGAGNGLGLLAGLELDGGKPGARGGAAGPGAGAGLDGLRSPTGPNPLRSLASMAILANAAGAQPRDPLRLPVPFSIAAALAPMASLLAAVAVVAAAVPSRVSFFAGWALAYEWGVLIFWACHVLLFYLAMRAGRANGKHQTPAALARRAPELAAARGGGARAPLASSVRRVGLVTLGICVAPWLSSILGLPSFTDRVLCSAVAGLPIAALSAAAMALQAERWWCAGVFMGAQAAAGGAGTVNGNGFESKAWDEEEGYHVS